MRYKINKVFWAWEHEKEEEWLNEMSAKGKQLVSVGFCQYIFEDGVEGEYIYRLEFLNKLSTHTESLSYLNFLEETGVEYIGSYLKWVYLRKKSSQGEFSLYSDNSSKISHVKRILLLILFVIPIEIFSILTNIPAAMDGRVANIFCITILSCILLFILFGATKLLIKLRKLKNENIISE